MNDVTVGDILFWDEKIFKLLIKKLSLISRRIFRTRSKKPPANKNYG